MARYKGYWNKDTQEFDWYTAEQIADYRAKVRNNPVAPMIIQDTIPAVRHHAAMVTTESRSQFDALCKATGTAPREAPISFRDSTAKPLERQHLDEIKQDIDQATRRAANDLRWGQAKLDEDKQHIAASINQSLEAKGFNTKLPRFD